MLMSIGVLLVTLADTRGIRIHLHVFCVLFLDVDARLRAAYSLHVIYDESFVYPEHFHVSSVSKLFVFQMHEMWGEL